MRFSNICALLLAPLALASPLATPSPSPDTVSIIQRDAPASIIEARHQSVSQRINTVVDESHKVTEMCQKYQAGFWESFHLYKQFKTCYKSVEHAEKAARQSGPLGEPESAKVREALERLTPEFTLVSKALQERRSLIANTRYRSYFTSEITKLQKNVATFYGTLTIKCTSPHQSRIKELGGEADKQFESVKRELDSKYNARRSLETREDEGEEKEGFEGPVERFHFPHFHIPGHFGAKRSLEARGDEEAHEAFHVPKFPGFQQFPDFHIPGKSDDKSDKSEEGESEHFHIPSKRGEFGDFSAMFESFISSPGKKGDLEAMLLPMKTGFSFEEAVEIIKMLIQMVESSSSDSKGSDAHGFLLGLMGQLTSVGDVKKAVGRG